MDWTRFNSFGESKNKAFEAMCNQLFELWCRRTYKEEIQGFMIINGSGGDGGVEAIAKLKNEKIIAVQAKWFPERIENNQINQIRNSINEAMKIRPSIVKYIVCIPRDLTSMRVTKGNKITQKTEESRWLTLVDEMKNKYPLLELELWTESTLSLQLTNDDAKGVYKFWFDRAEISEDVLKISFELQEKGWLDERYIPDIHGKGIIDYRLSLFIGNKEVKKNNVSKLNTLLNLYRDLIKSLDVYLDIIEKDKIDPQIKEDIFNLRNKSEYGYINTEKFIENYKNGVALFEDIKEIYFIYDCNSILEEFHGYNFDSQYKLIRMKLYDSVKKILEYNKWDVEQSIYKELTRYPLLVLGERGTGKTHGVADYIKELQTDSLNLGILIQASSISKEFTWKDILTRALGLSNTWSEDEIFSALESLSYRKEVNSFNELEEYRIESKVLICFDGIDECEPYNIWLERINQCSLISSKYPRIKFCFTSRPYVFKNKELKNNILLPPDGDVPVEKLFNKYIHEYDVKIKEKNWIKWSLKTPLALKLFCINYQHSTITEGDKVSTTITKLISKKIEVIENEFIANTCNKYSKNDYIIFNSLVMLADYFMSNETIERDKLLTLLDNNIKTLEASDRGKIIDFLNKHGILYRYTIDEDIFLSVPKVIYKVGINTFFEYVIAISIIKDANENKDIYKFEFPKMIERRNGILQLLSIIFLEDYNILINHFKWIVSNIDEYRILNLIYFSLINVSPEISGRYKKYIMFIMMQSREALIECVNKVIIPSAKIRNHPLGAALLNEYLMSFKTLYERDVLWSLPSDVLEDDLYNAMKLNTKGLLNERYALTKSDKYSDLPLIYGWSLASLDNAHRKYCRKELTKWGMSNPEEFIYLMDMLYKSNDQQIKEDLLAIAMGIVYSNTLKIREVELFSRWVLKNIFDSERIIDTMDIAVRYYGRAIIEFAYNKSIVTEEERKRAIPPYKHDDRLLTLKKEALNGTRMGGYKDISYDLSRYVLCDPIEHKFFSERLEERNEQEFNCIDTFTADEVREYLSDDTLTKETRKELETFLNVLSKKEEDEFDLEEFLSRAITEDNIEEEVAVEEEFKFKELLKMSAQELGVDQVSSEQYIISSAYNYLLEVGMYERKYKNIYENPEYLIARRYRPATHGQKSIVMTFAEKYIWCFRNILYGYLADRLPYYSGEKSNYITDYEMLTDFVNTNHELEETSEIDIVTNKIFMPEDISPAINTVEKDANKIKRWMKETPPPNFEKWINIDFKFSTLFHDKLLVLHNTSYISDINRYGQTLMWINSLVIDRSNFKLLLNDIRKSRRYILRYFERDESLKTGTITSCYISPNEICMMNWLKQEEPYLFGSTILDGRLCEYRMIKTYEDCTVYIEEVGDKTYCLPSRYMRDLLSITEYKNNIFYDETKTAIAQYYEAGEGYDDYSSLLVVDKERLLSKLNNEGKQIFWISRVRREGTNIASEKYDDRLYDEFDKFYICWYDEGKFKSEEINMIY